MVKDVCRGLYRVNKGLHGIWGLGFREGVGFRVWSSEFWRLRVCLQQLNLKPDLPFSLLYCLWILLHNMQWLAETAGLPGSTMS